MRREERACFAVTEPDAGLDTTRLSTRAVRDGDKYLIHGQKIWTTTAQVADKIMLIARTSPINETDSPIDGLSLFYADLDRDYAEIKEIPKMGRKCVDSNSVFFDGMPVPAEDRIGEEGKGFRYLLHGLNPERILLAAGLVGLGRPRSTRQPHTPRSDRVRPADRDESGNTTSACRKLGGTGSGKPYGLWRHRNMTVAKTAARKRMPRNISPVRPPSKPRTNAIQNPRRDGICQGIPRRALFPGDVDPPDRPGKPANDLELSCGEGPRTAEVILKG